MDQIALGKIDAFNINVELNYMVIEPPRRHNKPIIQLIVDEGIRGSKLRSINRIRKAQEAMFISCITTTSRRNINLNYLSDWKDSREAKYGRHRSLLPFGKEAPTTAD